MTAQRRRLPNRVGMQRLLESSRRQADELLREQIDPEHLEALRTEAAGRLAELGDLIADINSRLRMAAADHFTLPPIVVPEPEVDDDASRLPWSRLIRIGRRQRER